jgi:TonB family protein
MPSTRTAADVFTIPEVARAACVADSVIRAAIDAGESKLIRGRFIAFEDAVRLARGFRTRATDATRPRDLFAPAPVDASRKSVPLAASGALHAGLLAAMVLIAGLGARGAPTEQRMLESARLVFLSTPGPGGGGGGGGLRQPRPAPKAKIRGSKSLESPVTVTRKVESREPEKRVEVAPPAVPEPKPDPVPPAPQPQPTPPVTAPVVSVPSATEDRAGVVKDGEGAPSHGPGTGGGTGTGTGTGSGEGNGAGIGDGSIAGIGGGPYRPGAGITPPSLLREVKPVYTEDGRRRGIEGEVEMDVVVRSDGTVGTVNITRGLGAGLDQRAIDAVRQWRFTPARRHGKPVDVLVEVAVEFRLR